MTAPCLLFGVPSKGTSRELHKASLVATLSILGPRYGISAAYQSESVGGITVARAILAARCLRDPRFTGLVLIDDDVGGFTAGDVARIVASGEDVVGGPCPQRTIHPDTIVKAVEAGIRGPELLRFLSPLCMVLHPPEYSARVTESLLEVKRIGTSFLYVSKAALERLAEAYTGKMVTVEVWPDLPIPMLFEYGRTADGQFIGEDYAFCDRWRELGGRVYADTEMALGHVGDQVFAGTPLSITYGLREAREAQRRATEPAPPLDVSAS